MFYKKAEKIGIFQQFIGMYKQETKGYKYNAFC